MEAVVWWRKKGRGGVGEEGEEAESSWQALLSLPDGGLSAVSALSQHGPCTNDEGRRYGFLLRLKTLNHTS